LSATSLGALGWSAHFAEAYSPYEGDGLVPGRVAVQHRGAYVVCTETGDVSAELAGRLRHDAVSGDLPVAGDWVVLRPHEHGSGATIHALLERRTAVSRKAAFQVVEEQVLAANVDVVLLMTGLDGDFNLRRLERYLATAWESGAQPAIVLSKADLSDNVEAAVAEVEAVALGVPVHPVSCMTGEGVDELRAYFTDNRTVALLGSSGVGKSTLINAFLGADVQATAEVRRDGRGRHTTTTRELVLVPGGGLVLDTPGMRELQLWDAQEGFGTAFSDVESLFEHCRFRDCRHEKEPGCAVKRALADGSLDADRYRSYQKLQRELRMLELKQDRRARAEQGRKLRRQARARRHPKKW
jgi:ribosome biogenesis GTPase / thiamine phosphate phosphatase